MATSNRSDLQRNSRYAQGGTSTVVGNRITWWDRTVFPTSALDVNLVITRKYARRPDVLAYDMYGSASLQWFVLQYNNISDVNVDFVEGATITLPTRDRLFRELLSKS